MNRTPNHPARSVVTIRTNYIVVVRSNKLFFFFTLHVFCEMSKTLNYACGNDEVQLEIVINLSAGAEREIKPSNYFL